MKTSNYTTDKLIEIQHELQNQKLWNVEIPNWVNQYPAKGVIAEAGFIDWLQFIFLPNKMNETKNNTINLTSINIALQAKTALGSNEKYQAIMNLLIELDSLSS